jgi:hypothetical protein
MIRESGGWSSKSGGCENQVREEKNRKIVKMIGKEKHIFATLRINRTRRRNFKFYL